MHSSLQYLHRERNGETNHDKTKLNCAATLHTSFKHLHCQTENMKSATSISTYEKLLQRTEWKLKREQILQRDSFKCRSCKSVFGLQVHHKQYQRFKSNGKYKSPWSYENKYLITLCNDCHRTGHQHYKIPIINL